MKIKFANYEAILIKEDNSRTSLKCNFLDQALKHFKQSKAIKMVVFKSTHNNTRLKQFAEYGLEFK